MKLAFDALTQRFGDLRSLLVGHMLRRDDDTNLAASLNGISLLHAFKRQSEFLQPIQSLDITGHRLGARTGTHGGNRVSQNHQTGVNGFGFHLFMVRRNGVDHDRGFTVTFHEVGADDGVAALILALDTFADVVEQAGAFGDTWIEANFARDQRTKQAHLDGVIECVLSVREAIFQAAEQLDDLGVQSIDAETLHGVFTGLHDVDFHLGTGASNEFFNARRMNAAVLNQCFEGKPGNFTPNRIEGGNEHHLRCFVDQERHARRRLEGFDVATFTTDNAAFHLLAREMNDGCGNVVIGPRCHALHRRDQDTLGVTLQLLFGFFHRLTTQRTQLILTLNHDFVAEGAPDLLGIHLRHAFETVA